MTQPLYGANASQIKRNRRIAEMLMSNSFDASPTNPYGAIARIAQGFVGGMKDKEADKLQEQQNQTIAQMLGAEGTTPDQLEAAGVQYENPMLVGMAGNRRQQSNWQKGFDADQTYRGQQQQNWQQGFNADNSYRNQNLGLEREKFDWQKNAPPNPTGDMQEYEYSQQNPGFAEYQTNLKKAGATNVNTTVGGSNETELGKKLSGKEGEAWSGYLDSANVSGSTLQDLGALDELLKSAPQGPITGRLAEAFPGFSSSGDAVQSIVMRVAPTLRTPGSGSTSDVEYEGMLKSLPRLRNSPQGNAMISGVMKAKAQLNVERGQIVAAYQNRQIDEQTARAKMQELNQRSIMSPELKAMLGGDTAAQPAQNDIDPLLDKYAPMNP